MANACKYVEHFALSRQCIANSIRRQQRQLQLSRNCNRRLIARLFLAAEMALQLDVNISVAEYLAKPLHVFEAGLTPVLRQSMRQRALLAARQANTAQLLQAA